MVFLCSPNNPTGKVYTEGELKELAEVLVHHSRKQGKSIYLVSDEPYRKIIYDGVSVPSIFDVYNDSFVVTSFSKDLSLPGERIGYCAANPEISDKEMVLSGLVLCNRILGYVNAPALMQRIVARLLETLFEHQRQAPTLQFERRSRRNHQPFLHRRPQKTHRRHDVPYPSMAGPRGRYVGGHTFVEEAEQPWRNLR